MDGRKKKCYKARKKRGEKEREGKKGRKGGGEDRKRGNIRAEI